MVGPDPDCPLLIHLGRLAAQVHASVANLIANNKGSCGDDCRQANVDNETKLKEAQAATPAWLQALHTWDNNQTVAHALDAAVYWADQARRSGWEGVAEDEWRHLEYQVGILRDVYNTQISGHGCHPQRPPNHQ